MAPGGRPVGSADPMVREERRGSVVWLTLDAPERLNAFTGGGYTELQAGIERAAADPDVRVVVLTGAGRAFSAGADRSLFDGTATPDHARQVGRDFQAMIHTMAGCDTPIIAAVNGLAVGIGCTLLLQCDLILLAETARLRMPFASLGIVPEAGSSVLLPARARWGDVAWALFTGDWIDAATAKEMGLAWRVVPDADLVDEATRAAAAVAEQDPGAVAAAKRLLIEGRADAVRAAIDREQAEMARLLARRRTDR